MTRRLVTAHLMILILCAMLLFKTLRCQADEDYIGYRREFYREDGARMSIDTDTAGWDVGLNNHVRVTGNFVNDAISGATPTGIPQFDKWKQPDFNYYFAPVYQSQFTTEYNNYINGNPYDPSVYTNFTGYQAYASNYAAVLATNEATPAAQSAYSNHLAFLAQNGYLNGANKVQTAKIVPDHRIAYSFGVPLSWGIHTLTPQYSYSREHDYHSYGAALNYSVLLNQKNTTLNTGWAHTTDRVRDSTLTIWNGKVSDDVLVGINQLLDSKSYLTFNFTYGQEYGYLDDPYRQVLYLDQVFTGFPSVTGEKRPRSRQKEIVYASYTRFFDAAHGSLDVDYRFFHDSFGIYSHTADLAWHQKLGKYFIFTPSFRYYYQTAASFYLVGIEDSSNIPAYYSSDYRLSKLNSYTVSGNLTMRLHKHFSIDLAYSRYVMQGLDGYTSSTAYPTANNYTVGGRIWF